MKIKHILIALSFGVLSGSLAALLNTLYLTPFIFIAFYDITLLTFIAICIIAPFVEEFFKLIGLYFMKMEENIDYLPEDWMLFGTLSGFGFGIIENAVYTFNVGAAYGSSAAIILLILRTFLTLPLHMIVTTIAGFGFGLWINTRNIKYFVHAITISICIHSLYNFITLII